MQLTFTKEQQIIQKVVRDFAHSEIAPYVEQMERGQFPREILRKMADIGLMGMPIPEQYGGSALDFISYVIAIHELSKVSPTIGVILSVHTTVGTNPILFFGTDKQKNHYIPKLTSGHYLGAFCLTEPGAGSDVAAIKTTAIKQADSYVLNGSKMFITNGGEAHLYIVFAVTDPKLGRKGISAFIVEKDTPGFIVGKDEKKMGLHGSRTVQLTFEDMRIPQENLLGQEGEGLKIALANLNTGRIGIAAQALGMAEGAFAHARQYAIDRKQFGKPLADHQGIAFKLADMGTSIEAAKLLVYQAAYRKQEGLPCEKEVSMAKLFASSTAMNVATEAIQVFGGYGYSEEYPVARYFRDAKVTEIYEGTSEIQRIVISKQLLG